MYPETAGIRVSNKSLKMSLVYHSWAIAASRKGQRKVSSESPSVRKAESREMKPSNKVEAIVEDKPERKTLSANEDSEVSDPAGGGGMELDSLNSGSMVFVNELQTQLEYLKKSLSLRGIDLEAVRIHASNLVLKYELLFVCMYV